jgi:hypothetical protein
MDRYRVYVDDKEVAELCLADVGRWITAHFGSDWQWCRSGPGGEHFAQDYGGHTLAQVVRVDAEDALLAACEAALEELEDADHSRVRIRQIEDAIALAREGQG